MNNGLQNARSDFLFMLATVKAAIPNFLGGWVYFLEEADAEYSSDPDVTQHIRTKIVVSATLTNLLYKSTASHERCTLFLNSSSLL